MADDWRGHSRLTYETARVVVTLIVRSHMVRLSILGPDLVPATGSVILMSNHESNLDPVLMAWSLRRPVAIPGKKELFQIPLFGTLLRGLGSYPVDRDAVDAASLRRSVEVLRGGGVLVVFPEGRRSREGQVGPFQRTLTKLSLRQGIPVVPVGLAGTGRMLAPGMKVPRLGQGVGIVFGEPIVLDRLYGARPSAEETAAATETIRRRVVAARDQAAVLAGLA